MHSYGDWPDENFNMVDAAAEFIGIGIRRYGRINVRQYKEKYGTPRVYCQFGWSSFYSIWRPHYCWVPKWWPYSLDLTISWYLMPVLNRVVVPIQVKIYRHFYQRAIQKWTSIKKEIIYGADYPELLKGLLN